MASLFRPKLATYVINEKVTIDTTDREDHTFCGITFPIQCKSVLPVDHIVINSISVRGALGPLTVWITKPDAEGVSIPKPQPRQIGGRSMRSVHYNLRNLENNEGSTVKSGQMIMKERYWDKIYEKTHSPSYRQYCKLDLGKNPIILKPGEIRGIYIHSTHESDQAIVYDNQQKLKTHDDQFLTVLPGRSHVSPKIFGNRPIWGWGNAWRDNREFVGKINYGVVYKLWNPSENLSFGGNFRSMAHVLFMCQRRWESPVSMLCDECIFYILNMCRWDWMGDDFNILRIHRKKVKALEAVRANEADDENDEDSVDSGGNADNEIDEVSDNEGNDEAVVTVRDTGSPKAGLPEEVHLEQDEESYDSDYGDGESEDDSDSDDGNDDHRGSSMFQYVYYDDCGSSDEEREAEIERQRQERRRLIWLRNNFAQHFRGIHVFGTTDDDGDDNDDDDYS